MVHEMTMEEMITVSYILLAIAVVIGIVAVVLFFTLKIPKAYRVVKGQKSSKKRHKRKKRKRYVQQKRNAGKSISVTAKLDEKRQQNSETEVFCEDEVRFTMLQDITYVHVEEEL